MRSQPRGLMARVRMWGVKRVGVKRGTWCPLRFAFLFVWDGDAVCCQNWR